MRTEEAMNHRPSENCLCDACPWATRERERAAASEAAARERERAAARARAREAERTATARGRCYACGADAAGLARPAGDPLAQPVPACTRHRWAELSAPATAVASAPATAVASNPIASALAGVVGAGHPVAELEALAALLSAAQLAALRDCAGRFSRVCDCPDRTARALEARSLARRLDPTLPASAYVLTPLGEQLAHWLRRGDELQLYADQLDRERELDELDDVHNEVHGRGHQVRK